MAAYVLKQQWHTDVFHRTISIDGKSKRLAFRKKESTDLTPEQLEAIQAQGGAPIEPVRQPKATSAAAVSKPERPKKGK